MKITFLGTAGGRFAVTRQARASGGIMIDMDNERIHLDPGPGALVRAKEYGIDISRLTAVAVSHCHPDHYADAELVLEAMTSGTHDTRGMLIGSRNVMEGSGDFRPAFSRYHLSAPEKRFTLTPGQSAQLKGVRITATRTFHGDPEGVGFVFKGSKKIGYASDGSYFAGQEEPFEGCDYLILNVLRPHGKPWPKHMTVDDAIKLIDAARPKNVLITHFGMLMLEAGPEKEARYIEEKTGIRTTAARDNMVITEEDIISKTSQGSPSPAGGLGKWMK